MKKSDILQAVKFALFSASAGIVQVGSFELLKILLQKLVYETPEEVPYWPVYLTSLVLSVLWNFTFNRRFTFKSAANIPVAMAKVAGFYLVFTPLSTWLGDLAAQRNITDEIVLAVTMIANLVLEYLFCKFVVYRGQENTLEEKPKEE